MSYLYVIHLHLHYMLLFILIIIFIFYIFLYLSWDSVICTLRCCFTQGILMNSYNLFRNNSMYFTYFCSMFFPFSSSSWPFWESFYCHFCGIKISFYIIDRYISEHDIETNLDATKMAIERFPEGSWWWREGKNIEQK